MVRDITHIVPSRKHAHTHTNIHNWSVEKKHLHFNCCIAEDYQLEGTAVVELWTGHNLSLHYMGFLPNIYYLSIASIA